MKFSQKIPRGAHQERPHLSVNRAMCANKPTIDKFFVTHQHLLNIFDIENPLHIWNCDESRVQDMPKEEDITGVTRENVHTMSPKEQGETTTVLTFTNTCGQVYPPLVIFKGAKVNDAWVANVPSNITTKASPKGWINKDVFFRYSIRWVQWLKRCNCLNKKHLLLLDAQKSHIYNLPFLNLMVANKIEVLAIPGCTSHVL